MEHIVQFGIGIDDDAIVRAIKEKAESTIIKDLTHKSSEALFNTECWRGKEEVKKPTDFFKKFMLDWFNENKEEVLEVAGRCVAEKIMKSPKMKEQLIQVATNNQ